MKNINFEESSRKLLMFLVLTCQSHNKLNVEELNELYDTLNSTDDFYTDNLAFKFLTDEFVVFLYHLEVMGIKINFRPDFKNNKTAKIFLENNFLELFRVKQSLLYQFTKIQIDGIIKQTPSEKIKKRIFEEITKNLIICDDLNISLVPPQYFVTSDSYDSKSDLKHNEQIEKHIEQEIEMDFN